MSVLDEIGGYLALAGLASSSGAGGYTLVQHWLPDSTALPNKTVALIETGGAPPSLPLELDHPGFQVQVRGEPVTRVATTFTDTRAQADAIFAALHGLGPKTLPSTSAAASRYYPFIAANHSPALLHVDPVGRPVMVCNFTATRSRT